jgi:predicted transposase YbfD/YdcC
MGYRLDPDERFQAVQGIASSPPNLVWRDEFIIFSYCNLIKFIHIEVCFTHQTNFFTPERYRLRPTMPRFPLLKLTLILILSVILPAQSARITTPPIIGAPGPSGWQVDPGRGNLSLSIPFGTVPGEIPITVDFSMNGTFVSYCYDIGYLPYLGWLLRATACTSNRIQISEVANKVLDLKGCIVTLDSMGCQREIAKKIVAKRADYILALKGNQPGLLKTVQACFARLDADPQGMAHHATLSVERHHGREESRRVTCLSAVAHLQDRPLFDWPKMETLVRVETETNRGGKVFTQVRYYISSLAPHQAEAIAQGIRSHWGIKNQLHWILDVVFNEDTNRTRKGNGPECSAILRHIVLNLLRQDPNPKTGSISYKRMLAAMSPDYRMAALLGFPLAPSRENQG